MVLSVYLAHSSKQKVGKYFVSFWLKSLRTIREAKNNGFCLISKKCQALWAFLQQTKTDQRKKSNKLTLQSRKNLFKVWDNFYN